MSLEYQPTSVVTVTRDQIAAKLAGEAVILHLNSGIYFGLNEVGARIWDLIQQPRSVQALIDAICAEYEVEPARCARDLNDLLGRLEAQKLVEITPGS